jgi:transposase
LNSKLHAVTDQHGRPIALLLTEGQMNDHKGAKLLYPALAGDTARIADRGYDSDAFREALKAKDISACIPAKSNRKQPAVHDAALYRTRAKIEIMFGRLKDWRCIATRHDRCTHTFFSAICIVAAVIFWL